MLTETVFFKRNNIKAEPELDRNLPKTIYLIGAYANTLGELRLIVICDGRFQTLPSEFLLMQYQGQFYDSFLSEKKP